MASSKKLTPLHQIKDFPWMTLFLTMFLGLDFQVVVRHLILEPFSRPIQIQQVHTRLVAFLVISQEENRIIGQNSLD